MPRLRFLLRSLVFAATASAAPILLVPVMESGAPRLLADDARPQDALLPRGKILASPADQSFSDEKPWLIPVIVASIIIVFLLGACVRYCFGTDCQAKAERRRDDDARGPKVLQVVQDERDIESSEWMRGEMTVTGDAGKGWTAVLPTEPPPAKLARPADNDRLPSHLQVCR
jgi:hypothetical protein